MTAGMCPGDGTAVPCASSVHFAEIAGPHRETNPMQHEPCGLLRDTQRSRQLTRGRAVFCVGDQPHGNKPLVQAERGRLKDRPDFRAELFLARSALELGARGELTDILAAALRAGDFAVRPLNGNQVVMADRAVRKISDGLDQRFRFVVVHDSGPVPDSPTAVLSKGCADL
jgi:hypothetical protein